MNNTIGILRKLISERRTIKPDMFSGERVDDALIQEILEQANWAPTHGYTEPWRFTVFTGTGLKKLGNFLADFDQPDKDGGDFNEMRYERLRSRPLKSSHVLGIGLKRGDNPKVPEIEEICSVAMAVQNMWLTTHALGLGAYWSTGEMAFTPEMRDFFGLSENDLSLGLFYIGRPAHDHPKGRRLSSIEEKIHWVRS